MRAPRDHAIAPPMPEIRNPLEDRPSGAPQTDSARTVWLKMLGLLAGIAAFGVLVFWISRTVRLNF